MSEAAGQIVTFYSYKGGVGRTMSLANVAYMAACAGKKVLVMDWDLEAPGLVYYFKALLTSDEARRIKDVPGVLDMLHDWKDAVSKQDLSEAGLEALLRSYEEGLAFSPYVTTIGSHPFVTNDGVIDYMGPGAKLISGHEDRLYAEALARFSWSQFFDDLRGGLLLNYLRNWGKRNYDYVFIDSRTGYADVSGICTTQLPDTVALCFILNRQNIDGMARVASSVAAKRGAEVAIRPTPMRTTREGSAEESDAMARAATVLQRGSGLSLDQIQADLKQLRVRQTDGVPFTEGLASFYSDDPKYDVGIANYVQLASYLLGIEISHPQLDAAVIELVRRRSSPQQATIDFLKGLDAKEPARALTDLQRLLEVAIEDARDECEFSSDYQRALIGAAFQLPPPRTSDGAQVFATQMQAIILCHAIAAARSSSEWAALLLEYVESHLQHIMFAMDPNEEHSTISDLDDMVEDVEEKLAPQAILTRLALYRRAARIDLQYKQSAAAARHFGFLKILLDHASDLYATPTQTFKDSLLVSQIDVQMLGGDLYDQMGDVDRAIAEYETGLKYDVKNVASERGVEAERLRFNINQRLARLLAKHNDPRAIDYVLASARTGFGSKQSLARAPLMLPILLDMRASEDQLVEYARLVFGQSESAERYYLPAVFSSSHETPREFIRLCSRFIERMNTPPAMGAVEATMRVAASIEGLLRSLAKRRGVTSNRDMVEIDNAAKEFASLVARYTGDSSLVTNLLGWRSA